MNLFALRPLRPKFPYLNHHSIPHCSSAIQFQSSHRSPMGANLCSFRRSCAGGTTPAAASGDGYAICEWRRLKWWRREAIEIEVKREKEASIEEKELKSEYRSLEELLLASPGAPAESERGFGNSGKFSVSKHGGFKRKVHPTRICNSSSFFSERSGAIGESVAEDEISGGGFSFCRSESGNLKKKVSFRLPEVTEVIVIYSPEDGAPAVDANVVAS